RPIDGSGQVLSSLLPDDGCNLRSVLPKKAFDIFQCGQGIACTRVAVCGHFAGQQFAIDQDTIAIPEDGLKHHIDTLTITRLAPPTPARGPKPGDIEVFVGRPRRSPPDGA